MGNMDLPRRLFIIHHGLPRGLCIIRLHEYRYVLIYTYGNLKAASKVTVKLPSYSVRMKCHEHLNIVSAILVHSIIMGWEWSSLEYFIVIFIVCVGAPTYKQQTQLFME